MSSWHPVLLLLSCLHLQVLSLYSKIGLWNRRCFVEDVPENTMITCNWALHLYNQSKAAYDEAPSEDGNMYLTIHSSRMIDDDTDDDTASPSISGNLRHEQHLTKGSGKVHFLAEDYGQYEWCFEMQPGDGGMGGAVKNTGKFKMDVTREFHEESDQEMIEDIELAIITSLGRAMRKAKQIKAEQRHYKKREEEFRTISYLTGARVIWYGAVTGLTVISTSCFMMMNLRSFFIAKKLV